MYARVKKSFKGNFEGKFQRTPGEVYSRLPSRAQLEKTRTMESMRLNRGRNYPLFSVSGLISERL